MRLMFAGCLSCVVLLLGAGVARAQINIVPEPQHVTMEQGAFVLHSGETITTPADPRAQWIANFLREKIDSQTGIALRVAKSSASNGITLKIDPSIKGDNAYHLDVTPSRVVIVANDNRGLFWGVQSLRQLLPLHREAAPAIPAVRIEDAPRYKWRGMMLDVSRHFYPVSFIKQQIRLMSYYKFNVFHWHLTDDQGWRIQIPQYPKLTSVGAWRTEPDGQRYGGFYTDQQIREVVAYAKARNVMVVPEIEMPGHSSAAIAAYPELACNDKPIKVPTSWGVLTNVDCVGKDSTFTFIENVLDEVTRLFPSPYIHIGTDEVPQGVWADCKACAGLAKAHHFKDDEPGLHSYFVSRIQKYLASKGKTLIGWDEILEGGVSPDAIVEVWHGSAFAAQAMAGGNRVIVAWPFYLNTPVDRMTLQDLYLHDPFKDQLLKKYPRKVMGGEVCLWGEDATPLNGNERLYPRMLAVAEHLWNPSADDWSGFLRRSKAQEAWLASQHVAYGPADQDLVFYRTSFNPTYRRWRITAVRGFSDLQLHYTLNGTQPTAKSSAFGNVLDVYKPEAITVAPFRGDVQYQASQRFTFVPSLALGDSVKAAVSPARGSASQLTDGILGGNGTRYDAAWRWVVWPDAGMDVTVDLDKVEPIRSIAVGFLQAEGYGAGLPDSVTFEVSRDGEHWQTLHVDHPGVGYTDAGLMRRHSVGYTLPAKQEVRYVRVLAKVRDPSRVRIFADEVIVR